MTDQVMYYRYLARNCGIWPVARAMRKAGYSIWQCRWVLLSNEDYPRLSADDSAGYTARK